MKRFTSFVAAAAFLACAVPSQAQLTINWDENNQFILYPEDLVCEGGASYDEDEGAFVFDGTPGKLMFNIPAGQTLDLSDVATIQVNGTLNDSPLTNFSWSNEDPLAHFRIHDRDNGLINYWFGSRYNINLLAVDDKVEGNTSNTFAYYSTHVDSLFWDTRDPIVEKDAETGEVLSSTPVTGMIFIDEIVFTKTKEIDPMAISPAMFFEWSNWDGTGEPVSVAGCDYKVGESVGVGAVVYGTGSVLGKQFADLTEYAGIYAKGTPGVSLRLLFNRPDMEGGSAPITECNPTFNEEGEFEFYFAEVEAKEIEKNGEAYPYVHLNAIKTPWGFPEGVESCKVTKLNFIEKNGTSGINNVSVEAQKGDGVMYNLFGMPVNENYKGIVIKNGKKYLNR